MAHRRGRTSSPNYTALQIAGFAVRVLAVIGALVFVVIGFIAITNEHVAAGMSQIGLGLVVGLMYYATGEFLLAFRDIARNSWRQAGAMEEVAGKVQSKRQGG